MKIDIKKCDLCHAEFRSDDKPKRWDVTGGPVNISFKQCPGIQTEFIYDFLCYECASKINSSVKEITNSLFAPDTRKEGK